MRQQQLHLAVLQAVPVFCVHDAMHICTGVAKISNPKIITQICLYPCKDLSTATKEKTVVLDTGFFKNKIKLHGFCAPSAYIIYIYMYVLLLIRIDGT